MAGRVIWCVEHITTSEQRNSQLVFVNRVGRNIGEETYGLSLLAAITVVNDNNNDSNKTDAGEYPNDRADNAYKIQ